jgi:phage tail sheath gpL-like
MSISTAISNSLRTRAVGYQLLDEVFNPSSAYLPMRVALLGEANTANQTTLVTSPYTVTSLKDAGDKYGYGSPIYQMVRILKPIFGGGLGSIPLVVYPQLEPVGATATVIKLGVTVATTVTKTATHKLRINGRDNIDGKYFTFTVSQGQSATDVISSIVDCVSRVIGSPISAVAGTAGDVGKVVCTTVWKGLTSADVNIEVDTMNQSAGVVYAVSATTSGTGTPSITSALTSFGNEWNTLVINPYGSSVLADLETANGTQSTLTGKYATTVFKPFVALFGSTEDDKDDLVTITNASSRQDQVTNVLCPAPLSKAMPFEAAANMGVLVATIANETPHLGVGGKSYPDMPIPIDGIIGDLSELENRNFCATKGCSTVLVENGKYTVQDCVTTYAPTGIVTPKFSFVRDLIVDWNIEYNWKIIVLRDIQDKAIVRNDSAVRVSNTVSPKAVKALLIGLINDSTSLALINDAEFSKNSIQVGINNQNPTRLDISFKYKRTSTANQASTDAAVDFTYNL